MDDGELRSRLDKLDAAIAAAADPATIARLQEQLGELRGAMDTHTTGTEAWRTALDARLDSLAERLAPTPAPPEPEPDPTPDPAPPEPDPTPDPPEPPPVADPLPVPVDPPRRRGMLATLFLGRKSPE